MAIELALELLHAIALMGRHLQQRIAQLAVNREHGIEGHGVLLIDQVGLVQQQQGADACMLGGHQITVDQVGVWLGQGREDDHDQVDVGRHRLELAAGIGAAQFTAARQLRDDYPDALVAGAPHHPVPGDHGRQVGTQVAAEHLAGLRAFQGLDLYLHAKVGNHQSGLLRPQVTAFENLLRLGFAFGGAGSPFPLDFFDPPVLPAIELAFGHEGSKN